MKKHLLTVLAISLSSLLFSACFHQVPTPLPETPFDVISDADVGANDIDMRMSNEIQDILNITWGYGYGMGNVAEISSNAEIVQFINNYFNVMITPVLLLGNEINNISPPDIFVAYGDNKQIYQASGFTRTVSREMIEKHAPSYASLLNSVSYGWEINKSPHADDAFLGLSIYNGNIANLRGYSVYRLDWLDDLHISPNGTINELEKDKIFFTDIAFNQQQFEEIIWSFVHDKSYPKAVSSPTRVWRWAMWTTMACLKSFAACHITNGAGAAGKQCSSRIRFI